MKKRVLVTGATGFVGRQVLDYLATQDVYLTVIVREGKQSLFTNNPAVHNIITTVDLFAETSEWWADVMQGIDTLVHVAWYAEPGLYLQSSKNLDCLQGTLCMAKGAIQAGVRRFVGIGTCFEYDLSYGMLSTETPLKPLTPYAGAKAAAYMALTPALAANGIEFAWCRLFYLYGKGEDVRRLVPYLREKLAAGEPAELTSGNQIRDFIDVSEAGRLIGDVALGIVQGSVNICSGIPITVKELAEDIADEYGRRDLLKFAARPDNLIDPPCVVGIREHDHV
jgi:dTDP-6-deoxy-L-talose 4-dehydrogenase (NAD+)